MDKREQKKFLKFLPMLALLFLFFSLLSHKKKGNKAVVGINGVDFIGEGVLRSTGEAGGMEHTGVAKEKRSRELCREGRGRQHGRL